MKFMRFPALLCAGVLLLAGCSKEEEIYTEDNLPYGATFTTDKTGYAIPISYDRRFLDETQIRPAADILAAVQQQDAALYESVVPDFYLAYQKEMYDCEDTAGVLSSIHSILAEESGEDFTYDMVMVNDMATDRNSGELYNALMLLDGIYEGDGNFSDTVTSAWDLNVELDVMYDGDAKYTAITEQHVFLFQTADGIFCIV